MLNMTKQYDVAGAIIDYETGLLDAEQMAELFQYLIDTGLAWRLQGSYGRTAQHLIDVGVCHYPKEVH